jgi:hypothetical protein
MTGTVQSRRSFMYNSFLLGIAAVSCSVVTPAGRAQEAGAHDASSPFVDSCNTGPQADAKVYKSYYGMPATLVVSRDSLDDSSPVAPSNAEDDGY